MRANIIKRADKIKGKCLKPLSFVLCLFMAFGPASGILASSATNESIAYLDTLDQLAANEAAKELFTLAQIRELSRAKGAETQQAQSKMSIAQAEKDAADMKVYNARWNIMFPEAAAPGAEAALASAYTGQERAVTSLDDARATLESQKETAVYMGEKLFFDYLQLRESLVLLEQSIELGSEQLRIERLRARIGLSTGTEVLKKSLALDELMDNRQDLITKIDMVGRNLMRQIGKPGDLAFRLDPAFSIEGMKTEYDPDKLADLAIKNNLNLGVLNRGIDKGMETLKTTGMAPTERFQFGAELDSTILTRDNLIQNLRLLARSTVTGLNTSKAELALLEKTIEDKQAARKLMELQVSLGLAPKLGLMGAELELARAENNLLKVQQSYYLALRKAELLVKGVAIT